MSITLYGVVIATLCKSSLSWRFHTVSVLVIQMTCVARDGLTVAFNGAADREDKNTNAFRMFKRQLYHTSLAIVLDPLRPGITKPEVLRCPDSHYRRAIYGIAAHLMDYPEQAQAACVVEGWCPGCVFHSFCI